TVPQSEDRQSSEALSQIDEHGSERAAAAKYRTCQQDSEGLPGDGHRRERQGDRDLRDEAHERPERHDEDSVPEQGSRPWPHGIRQRHRARIYRHSNSSVSVQVIPFMTGTCGLATWPAGDCTSLLPHLKEILPDLHRLLVLHKEAESNARLVCRHLVEGLHHLHEPDRFARLHLPAFLHIGESLRARTAIKNTGHGGFDRVRLCHEFLPCLRTLSAASCRPV